MVLSPRLLHRCVRNASEVPDSPAELRSARLDSPHSREVEHLVARSGLVIIPVYCFEQTSVSL